MSNLATNLRVRLSRDELHQLRWLLGLALVLLAFWTLFDLEVGGLAWRTLFFATAALAMIFPGWPGRIPGWIRRWSLIFGAAALFTQFIATQFDIVSGLVLLVSLLALSRGLEYRRLREDWQLILLCLFIIVLSGVLTLSLLFGLQILIFTVVTMALLFVMNLLQRDAGRALGAADWKNFHWRRFLGRVRHALDLRQLLQAGAMFVALVAVSTIIFISMPRYQFEQSFSFSSLKGVAGFNSEIKYHTTNSITPDDSIALRVTPPPGATFTTPPYWRMIAFDEYKEDGFRPSQLSQSYNKSELVRYSANALLAESRRQPGKKDYAPGAWTFYLERNVSEYLPVLGLFDTLKFESKQNFWANADLKIFRIEQPASKVLAYEIQPTDYGQYLPASYMESSLNAAGKFTLAEAEGKLGRNVAHLVYPYTYFGLPADAGDRKIVDGLKDKILDAAAGGDRAQVSRADYLAAVVKYLEENHAPSMEMDLAAAEKNGHDILVRWLNTPKSAGWCELYAGSFVLLARAAGYPARVVAGYKGAAFNSSSSVPYYLVPQSFAHAWAEVFDRANNRWERWDPSPGAQFSLATAAAGLAGAGIVQESGWSAFFDSLRMIWYRRVINFDQTDQQELAQQAADYGKNFAATLGLWLKNCGDEFRSWFTGPVTAARYVILGLAMIAVLLAWRWRNLLRNQWLRLGGWLQPGRGRRLAPVRLDAGRWLRRFLPAWQAAAPALPGAERAQWDGVRNDLLALRYGPLDEVTDPAGTFQKARTLLRNSRRTER